MAFEYDETSFSMKTEKLKALAHPVRLCILHGLLQQGRSCPSEMQACLELPQSTVSQNLGRLRQMGIIKGTRQGLEIHYELVDEEVIAILEILFSEKEL